MRGRERRERNRGRERGVERGKESRGRERANEMERVRHPATMGGRAGRGTGERQR